MPRLSMLRWCRTRRMQQQNNNYNHLPNHMMSKSINFRIFLSKSAAHRSLVVIATRYLRAIVYLFNLHTLIMLCISLLSVFVCLRFGITWNMDFSLVAVGTVFPLTFTIQQGVRDHSVIAQLAASHSHVLYTAYTRRERATVLIANLKASGEEIALSTFPSLLVTRSPSAPPSVTALYYMHRDWVRFSAAAALFSSH